MTLALRATTPTIAAEPTPARAGRRDRRTRTAATVASAPPRVELMWTNMPAGSPGFARWAADVGHQIDQHGLTATASAIDALVILANQLGVAPIAVRVLADPTEPEPARLRAFARVMQAVVESR